MNALTNTDFHFDGQKNVYHGKVRDVYTVKNDLLVMVATDRISIRRGFTKRNSL